MPLRVKIQLDDNHICWALVARYLITTISQLNYCYITKLVLLRINFPGSRQTTTSLINEEPVGTDPNYFVAPDAEEVRDGDGDVDPESDFYFGECQFCSAETSPDRKFYLLFCDGPGHPTTSAFTLPDNKVSTFYLLTNSGTVLILQC